MCERSSNIWPVEGQKKFVLYLEADSRSQGTRYTTDSVNWVRATWRRESVNPGRVYDRKKLSTEIGDAALLALAATVGWILAVFDQKQANQS